MQFYKGDEKYERMSIHIHTSLPFYKGDEKYTSLPFYKGEWSGIFYYFII